MGWQLSQLPDEADIHAFGKDVDSSGQMIYP
jgi:hypothetical protein